MFESNFTQLAESGKSLSRCGDCNKYLAFIAKRPMRLYCKHCDQTYSLPGDADKVTEYNQLKCPLDGFEIVQILDRAGKRSPLCPMCYNEPPWEDAPRKMSCWECEHPSCKHAVTALGVCGCPEENCESRLLDVTFNLKRTPLPNWETEKTACIICDP